MLLLRKNRKSTVIAELREIKERAFSELKRLEDSLSYSRKEIESRDNQINLLSNQLESAKAFEVKLGERVDSIEELKKGILELEYQQTKIELEESKLEAVTLKEKLKNQVDQNGNLNSFLKTKTLKDEIAMLKSEVRIATETEEKSKKAMDDLALALREVVTEDNTSNEKLKLSQEHVNHLKEEIKVLKQELELQTNTSERLRGEAEESILAWTGKEIGFYKFQHSSKQRSELKDLLAKKEESLHFLTKENERSRINEAMDGENMKEFKRLLAVKAEANKSCEDKEQTEVITTSVSSLYEDHLDGRTTPRQMFNDDDTILKESVFDSGYTDLSGSGQFKDVDNNVNGRSNKNHSEDSEDKGFYMYGLYGQKKLFRKIGELILGMSE
ncbi:hypothetical protein E3N88_12117 [Mikania micrantha]|uniref:Uncharacterized protein n=1 Tax=Mikania micrantha TaxID=192012 RepID=A0A5N6P5X7_9ASTR|nr:hypothetical protein E3N88_12117 [Mikania micrantha]